MHIIKESKYSWKTWKLPSLGFACRRLFIVRCKTIEREKRVSLELTSFQIVFAVWRRKKEDATEKRRCLPTRNIHKKWHGRQEDRSEFLCISIEFE